MAKDEKPGWRDEPRRAPPRQEPKQQGPAPDPGPGHRETEREFL